MRDENSKAEGLSPSGVVAAIADGCYDWFAKPGLAPAPEGGNRRVLFESVRINRLEIRNRLVMGPMGNVGMAEPGGRPGDRMIAYFAERAAGGVGLIVSGMTPVSWKADPSYAERGGVSIFPRLDGSRAAFSGWKLVADVVRARGARFFVQLAPGIGRVGSPECLLTKGKLPVSASWNPNWYMPELLCRPLTDGEIRRLVERTGSVAADLKELGVDGVALHGHSGYLIEQLTDGAYNRRRLGRYADKRRFGIDLVRAIRESCGPSFPILYRIDLSLALRETYGGRMDSEPDLRRYRHGRAAEESLDYLEELVAAGVDAIDVDLGGYESWWLPHPPNGMPPATYLECARLVKERLASKGTLSRAGFPVPVIAVGKLGSPGRAEAAVSGGACDMVMLARPLLADPDWPNKVMAGREAEIRPCIGDHEGCLGQLASGGTPHCAVNARATFEHRMPAVPARTREARRVAVVGAGPTGITAAVLAAERGHEVVLFEERERVGGMLVPGSRPGIKWEVRDYLGWLEREIERATSRHALELRLGTAAEAAVLAASGYGAILVCAGGKPVSPKLPGVERAVQAVDLLRDPGLARGARKAVVVGGADVGCETASFLALEFGVETTVIDVLPRFMPKTCQSNRGYLLRQLDRAGVRLLPCTRLVAIGEGLVKAERTATRGVPDPTATWRPVLAPNVPNPFAPRPRGPTEALELPADLVVLACGIAPRSGLATELAALGAAPLVRALGDCSMPGRVLEAVQAGYAAASEL